MKEKALFRAEVLQAQSTQLFGQIRVARSPSFACITGFAMALVVAFITFATLGQVNRKTRLPGILLPKEGLISVSAPQAGIVSEWLVTEGQEVYAGQPLLRLISPRLLPNGDATALTAESLRQRQSALATERLLLQQQARQRDYALNDRERSLLTEIRHAKAEMETHQLRAQLAAKNWDRFEELSKNGFVSLAQAQQKQEEMLDLQLRERVAQRNTEVLQREVLNLRAERRAISSGLASSLAQLDRSFASLRQELHENEVRGGLIVAAPQAGTVSAFVQSSGQSVQLGQNLLSLIPGVRGDHDIESLVNEARPRASAMAAPALHAQLYATSRTAGFVQIGQTVWIRYSAYPYQKFGMAHGKVSFVSQSPIAPQDLPIGQAQSLLTAAHSNEPLYRISVELTQQYINTYGNARELKVGMSLEADLIQERRAVWEWLLEPVLAVSGSAKNLIASPK